MNETESVITSFAEDVETTASRVSGLWLYPAIIQQVLIAWHHAGFQKWHHLFKAEQRYYFEDASPASFSVSAIDI